MPYILTSRRRQVLSELKPGTILNAGELNFAITSIIDEYLHECGVSYRYINEVIGALECAKLELYRRVAARHEDEKLKEHGDVYRCIK